jgi:hypothetical protein
MLRQSYTKIYFLSLSRINPSISFGLEFNLDLMCSAVYGPGHKYVSYLYLVAPISLLLLNPIGFICMEFREELLPHILTNTEFLLFF